MENAISSDGKWCGVRDEIIEKVVSRYSSGGNFSDAPEGGQVLFPDDKTQEDHWSTTLDWDFEDIIQVDRKSEQVLGIFGMVLIVYRLTNGEVAYTARAFRMIFKDGPPTIMELMHRPIRLGGDIKINMLRDGVRAT